MSSKKIYEQVAQTYGVVKPLDVENVVRIFLEKTLQEIATGEEVTVGKLVKFYTQERKVSGSFGGKADQTKSIPKCKFLKLSHEHHSPAF